VGLRGDDGDLGSMLSLEDGSLIEFLRVIEGNGSSMDLRSLFSENELPRVDLRLAKPCSCDWSSCCDFLMLSLGRKDLGSSSSLKDFFLVCYIKKRVHKRGV
jgi:hypothetical protein